MTRSAFHTVNLKTTAPETTITHAVNALQPGSVIVLPTDTVYGIGCRFDDSNAIERIFSLKHRDANKSIAVLLGDLAQIDALTDTFPDSARDLAERFWPGGLTLIVPKKAGLPENLSHFPTIGIRIPNHEWTRELIQRVGPLAVTSVNLSGEPPARTIAEIPADWVNDLAAVYDDGPVKGGKASTVVDCATTPLRILREGPLSRESLGI